MGCERSAEFGKCARMCDVGSRRCAVGTPLPDSDLANTAIGVTVTRAALFGRQCGRRLLETA